MFYWTTGKLVLIYILTFLTFAPNPLFYRAIRENNGVTSNTDHRPPVVLPNDLPPPHRVLEGDKLVAEYGNVLILWNYLKIQYI